MATGGGNDAEPTAIPAAILHFEIGTRLPAAVRPPAAFRHRQLGMGECVVHVQGRQWHETRGVLGDLRYQRLMAVADHGVDAGQRGHLLRRPLRITAGDQDARSGIFAVRAAQEGAGGAVRLRRHTAGVGYDDVGLAKTGSRGQPAMAQLSAYDFAVRPAGATSEVLNVVFCHVASLINGWMPLKQAPFQVGSDQATSSPRRPIATALWSFFL